VSELSWRAGLDDGEIDAVRALADAATEADGVAPLGDHVLRHLGRGDREAAHLLAHDGPTLTGIAHLDLEPGVEPGDLEPGEPANGSAELVVHPAHRRAGLGTALVRELLARQPAGGTLRIWAHGELPGAVALAARLDLRKVRELRQLRLGLAAPPVVPALPDGVRIRAFRVGVDEPEFLRVNNAAFAWHPEQGGWPPEEIAEREREPWFDPDGFLLAVDPDDRLLGYHWTKVHPATGDTPPLGEVYVLGVDPAARGLRLGRALTLAGLRHLYDRGLRTVLLYVEADNDAAVRLYEGLGFTRWHTDVMYAR
jgi:mycothiol synthase